MPSVNIKRASEWAGMVPKTKVYIGIDPGVNTGLAIWCADGQEFVLIATSNFWETSELIRLLYYLYRDFEVVVEDPRGNKPTFSRGQSGAKLNRISQNVGANKRDAGLLIELCDILEVPVHKITPKDSKWKSRVFLAVTGFKGRTSQHGRDAAKLVYGLR